MAVQTRGVDWSIIGLTGASCVYIGAIRDKQLNDCNMSSFRGGMQGRCSVYVPGFYICTAAKQHGRHGFVAPNGRYAQRRAQQAIVEVYIGTLGQKEFCDFYIARNGGLMEWHPEKPSALVYVLALLYQYLDALNITVLDSVVERARIGM